MKYLFLSAVFALSMVPLTQPAAQETEIVTIGALTFTGDPFDQYWQKFSENFAARNVPDLGIKMLIRGETGPEEALMRAVRRGRVQMAAFTASGITAAVPEFDILRAPYLFSSQAEVDYVLDVHMAPLFEDLLAEKGLHLIAFSDEGWFNLYGDTVFNTPEDTHDVRMRALQSPASQSFLRSIGADMIQLPFSDVFTGLQTGLISGGETGTMIYAVAGLDSEAPALTLTRHAYSVGVTAASKPWFDALSEDHRKILSDSVPPVDVIRSILRAWVLDDLARVEARGVTVHSQPADQRAVWMAATEGSHATLIESIGGEAQALYDAVLEAKSVFANQTSR